jgi:hypothetical protein
MIQEKCKVKGCNKIIEGFTKKHVDTMMEQHMIKHKNEVKNAKNKKD